MRRNYLAWVTLAATLFFLLPSGLTAQTRMPQLKFTDRKLPNGLRILSAPDRSSPTVAIQVWYHVGSKDDPQSRSGFAHLLSTSCSRVPGT